MKSLVNALNNIAVALGNIALAIDANRKDKLSTGKSITSNNSPSAIVTKFSTSENYGHKHDISESPNQIWKPKI